MVTFNSERWLMPFVRSLIEQDYPLSMISLYITDNGSTDHTRALLSELQQTYGDKFAAFNVLHSENKGFGAGHNSAAELGSAPFILVTNPDLTFEKDSIQQLVIQASFDDEQTVSWETCQRPYEHPKHHDPITWETSWSSHACILMRRSAFEQCQGYDERIFLYGEDVELSYRFRAQGWQLRYCPIAIVNHHTYAEAEEIKPNQYVGSLSAHLYLRVRYGNWRDMIMLPLLTLRILIPSPFKGARRQLIKRIARDVVPHFFSLLSERKRDLVKGIAPFRGLDYELSRMGAFVTNLPLTDHKQKVSIITRTVAGRSQLLKQAGISVLQQTYPNIEWIVVEDGGQKHSGLMETFKQQAAIHIRYAPLAKVGRSAAGNHGLSIATGDWCIFLDDDDLLYADHVHCLLQAVKQQPSAVAAYALAWEIPSSKQANGEMVETDYLTHKAHQQHLP
jgi:GT2 family glycosyltransferase